MNLTDTSDLIQAILIILLSSFFPISAIVYMWFQREKRIKKLIDDFNLLGIGSESVDSISAMKSNKGNIWVNFLAHSLLTAFFSILGSCLLFVSKEDLDFLPFIKSAEEGVLPFLRYGFLGAYIFSMQLVYRRYTTLDLQPTVYMNCTLTIISSFAFNYTVFATIPGFDTNGDSTGIGYSLSAVLAFSLGYFPWLAIRWFNQISNAALGNKQHRTDSLPLSVIDGISQFHETRLRDEGIDNVQNLASVKIDDLLLNTRFNAQQVLEWVDQAILYLYVDQSSIDSYRRGGVRTLSDFRELWAPYYDDPAKKDQHQTNRVHKNSEEFSKARQNRALQVRSTPEYLDSLYASTFTGPNIAIIENYWDNLKKTTQQRQSLALEEEREEVRSVVEKAQICIFKKISNYDLHDRNRVILGEIAKILDPGFRAVDLDIKKIDEQPGALAGLAWWLWWLTADVEDASDFTEQARQCYEQAAKKLLDNPKLLYELSKFYVDLVENHDIAQAHAAKAYTVFKNEGDREAAILTLVISGWINIKANRLDDANKKIEDAMAMVDSSDTDKIKPTEILVNLHEIMKKMEDTFNDKEAFNTFYKLESTIEKIITDS